MSGPGDVLGLIRQGEATTRGDVQALTGLSRMTVALRIDALLEAGLIVEGLSSEATGGRRRRALNFNVEQARVLVAAVDSTRARTAITDLDGTILAEHVLDVSVDQGPQRVLNAVAESGRRLLVGSGPNAAGICGMGISVPGPIDPHTGRPSQPPIMPGWDAYPISEHLAHGLSGVPVFVANDADAAAFGEYCTGYRDTTSLCLVKVSTGIGTGIVIRGRSYQGVDGGAGDIGHVRLRGEDQRLCHCGGHGCLAAVASGEAVATALAGLGREATSGRDVGELLAQGDSAAARLTQQAGRRIGEVMSTVVCVLNPGVVLVGGDLASAPLLAGIRESLYANSLPRATRHLDLQLGSLGDDAAIVGLSRLVVDEQFSPAAVNARLG